MKRGRRALPITLVVIASILLLIGSFAVWAKRELLETDTWVDTSTELLENAAIQDALAGFLVTELYDNVDVEAELAARLPPQLHRWPGRWPGHCDSSPTRLPRGPLRSRRSTTSGRRRTAGPTPSS